MRRIHSVERGQRAKVGGVGFQIEGRICLRGGINIGQAVTGFRGRRAGQLRECDRERALMLRHARFRYARTVKCAGRDLGGRKVWDLRHRH